MNLHQQLIEKKIKDQDSKKKNKIKFKILFYLLRPEKNSSSIMVSVTYKSKRVRVASGYVIEPKYWNDKIQEVKVSYNSSKNKKLQDHMIFNHKLNELKNEIEKYFFEYINKEEELNLDEVKEYIKIITNIGINERSEDEKNKYLMVTAYSMYLDEKENSDNYKAGTLRRDRSIKHHLEKYEVKYKQKLTFSDINEDFYQNFKAMLNNDLNITNNTVTTIIKKFKTFLHWAARKELVDPDNIKIMKSGAEKEAQVIALSEEELQAIIDLKDLSDKLNRTRDLFLIQCYSGLRFSDLINLKTENVNFHNDEIRIYQIKTEEPLKIGVGNKLKQVLVKYLDENTDLNLPKISNQKYNQNLKELARRAEINDPIQITRYYGKKRIDVVKMKHQLVSSHTGRRTFITLALKKGIMPEMVMKVSGHKRRETFQKYVKITQNEAVEAVKNIF